VLKVDPGKIESGRPLNELGLDSLTSFQLKNKIENEIGITLPVGKFLQKPTVESLALTIGEVLETAGSEQRTESAGAERKDGKRVLSARQQWAWQALQKDGAIDRYGWMEISGALSIKPGFDIDRLEQAFRATVAAHEGLRSHFPAVDGQPTVELWPVSSFAIDITDATQRSESEFRADLQQAVNERHDIANDRLVNLRVYRRPNHTAVLLVRAHHLVMDGHGFGTTIRELLERYFGLHGAADPARAADYFEFARNQMRQLEGDVGQADRNFWAQYLAGAPEPIGKTLAKRGKSNPRGTGASVRRFIANEAELPVRASARKLSVPLHALMTAAGQVLLHGLTGGTDLLVASSFSNRQSAAQEKLVGWLSNVTMLRTDFDPAASFRDHVAKVASGWAEVLPHSSYPSHMIQQAAAENGGKALANGQFGVFMTWPDNMERAGFERVFLSPPGTVHRFGEIELSLLPTEVAGAGDDMMDALVYYQEMEGSLMLNFQYGIHLFDATEAEKIMDRFVAILQQAIANPDSKLGDLAAPT
jgi:acyl carrier protein